MFSKNDRRSNWGRNPNETTTRVYNLSWLKAQASNVIVTSTLKIYDLQTWVLFDPRATYSFIAKEFVVLINKSSESMESPLVVITPNGRTLLADCLIRVYVIMIGDTNLVMLDIVVYDIIIGMDWLS